MAVNAKSGESDMARCPGVFLKSGLDWAAWFDLVRSGPLPKGWEPEKPALLAHDPGVFVQKCPENHVSRGENVRESDSASSTG